MENIRVKILEHNLSGMPRFLAKLTQRGHVLNSMDDVVSLYDSEVIQRPSKELMQMPHTTLRRMNYITIAIFGLSTKAASQLRTHAKRLTFMSTSSQYSSFENRPDNFVIPDNLNQDQMKVMLDALKNVEDAYKRLLSMGVPKDEAGYLLPQSLRKVLIVSGNLDDWEYVLRTRLCARNTTETRYIACLIENAIHEDCGEEFIVNMKANCALDKCREGKFYCGGTNEL